MKYLQYLTDRMLVTSALQVKNLRVIQKDKGLKRESPFAHILLG